MIKITLDASLCVSGENLLLMSMLYDLQEEFEEAIRMTENTFKASDLPGIIDYLEVHVKSLLGPKMDHQTELAQTVGEEFRHLQTISELFTFLQEKYVSWFNFELVTKLVSIFLWGNRLLKRDWSSYEAKLKDCFINSGALISDAGTVQFGVTDVPPGTRVMIAQIDRDDYALDYLLFFRKAIPRQMGVPETMLYFSFVHIGSRQLHYLIPDYLYSVLFPLTMKQQEQLAGIGITEITCGDFFYNFKEVSMTINAIFLMFGF